MLESSKDQNELVKEHICSINKYLIENRNNKTNEWIKIKLENNFFDTMYMYMTPFSNYLIIDRSIRLFLDKEVAYKEDESGSSWLGNYTDLALVVINQWDKIKDEFLNKLKEQEKAIDKLSKFRV